MAGYTPPFIITNKALRLIATISEKTEIQARPPVRTPHGSEIPKSPEGGALESHLKAPRVEKRKGEN